VFLRAMKRIIITTGVVAALSLLPAPTANATRTASAIPAHPSVAGSPWNGLGLETWDTPGYYGGNNGGGPLQCSPFTYQCQGVSPRR
jgi:hypothetical protein